MNYPRVSIQVLNWNRWQYTIRCLESIYQITYPNYDVILIDNDSEDDSVEKIKEWAEGKIPVEDKFVKYNPEGKPITYIEYQSAEVEAGGGREKEIGSLPSDKKLILIKNGQNYGGAKARNIATRYALGVLDSEYVLFLDNDTIVSPGFLDELVNVANKEPSAGILGAKISRYSEPDIIWGAGGMINYWTFSMLGGQATITTLAQFKDAVEVDTIALCCMLISRELCQTVGLLDENFFWSMEDLDITIRAAKQGFKVLTVPKSEIWHDSVRPPGYTERLGDIQMYYVPKDKLILMQKHWSKLQFASAIPFVLWPIVIFFLHCLLRRRDWNYLKLSLRGILDYLKERKSYR